MSSYDDLFKYFSSTGLWVPQRQTACLAHHLFLSPGTEPGTWQTSPQRAVTCCLPFLLFPVPSLPNALWSALPQTCTCQGNQFVTVVQSLCLPLCDPMDWQQRQSLLRFTSIESVMLCSHLILCCRLLLLPLIFLTIGVFSSESGSSHQWPKYWSSSISPSNESSRLISFRIDWKGNQWPLHF